MFIKRLMPVLMFIGSVFCFHIQPSQAQVDKAWVVTTCGTAPSGFSLSGSGYPAGGQYPVTMDINGNLCIGSSGGGGTVTALQGTTPWVDNITQFGGNNVVTGTGAGGNGIPRVTVSNDSTVGLVAGSAIGGYEFQAPIIPTVQNAAYSAGQALGGLQTISIGSTNGLSGILTQIQVASKGGSTANLVVYVWSKNPSNTTCTDKTNFVASQTDNQYLVVPPQSITPALAVTAQDTTTYASSSNLVGNFNNGSSNTDLYVCVLANASVTPATTTDLRFTIQGTKDAP